MIRAPTRGAKTSPRFAAPPWNASSAPWLDLDAHLPPDHLAHDIRGAMPHLDWTPLYLTYGRRGQAPHPPDLMLAIVFVARRRGQRTPSQWYRDTQENVALWWRGFGIQPSRSCWYAFRERTGAWLATRNTTVVHQAVADELTTAPRGAVDGSAVAAHASRRRLLNGARLDNRFAQLKAVAHEEAAGEETGPCPGWMGNTPTGRQRQQHRSRQAQEPLARLQVANTQRPPSQRREPATIVISPGAPASALGLDQDHVLRPVYTVETAQAQSVYRLRGQTIEMVFADVKEPRGLRRFSGHG